MTTLLEDRLAEALMHMKACGDCAEDAWNACEGGREALAALAEYDRARQQPAQPEICGRCGKPRSELCGDDFIPMPSPQPGVSSAAVDVVTEEMRMAGLEAANLCIRVQSAAGNIKMTSVSDVDCEAIYLAMRAATPRAEPQPAQGGEITQLMQFYDVDTIDALVLAQAQHIERLQSKLPPNDMPIRTHVREG